MENKKEMTAPNVSVGADTEQSILKCTNISINDNDENIKDLDESFLDKPTYPADYAGNTLKYRAF